MAVVCILCALTFALECCVKPLETCMSKLMVVEEESDEAGSNRVTASGRPAGYN